MNVVSAVIPKRDEAPAVTIHGKYDETRKMLTAQWHGTKDVRVVEAPVPLVTDPQDVVIRVTSAAICGSDLHLYTNTIPGMKSGDILGHETMGEVVEVGPEVKQIKKGDRVVVSFDIGCGSCFYCNRQLFTSCDNTNPSKEQEMMYGHRSGGFFGYSAMTGSWDGGQAEYLRVPFADLNCLKVPPHLSDDQVILLSDVLATAWHATEMGEVAQGDRVAIWGAGPVGMLAAHCAFKRGAERVILIDREEHRLAFARERVPGGKLETINFKEKKPYAALRELFPDGTAPDVCIEAVGLHYTNSWLHWFETALKLETDPSEIVNELIQCCRKGGRIAIAGAYAGYCNHFNIGAYMEKCLTMKAGQTPVQRYWHKLLGMVEDGTLEPTFVITHRPPLSDASNAYKIFNNKEDGCVKVVMKPWKDAGTAAAK